MISTATPQTHVISNTLCTVLFEQAKRSPDKVAYRFLNGKAEVEATLSYRQLLERASIMAQHLDPFRGERALLLLPPGLDYVVAFFGCLLAGVVAVPLYPPRKNSSVERIRCVASDADATVAIGHRATPDQCAEVKAAIKHWVFAEEQSETAPSIKDKSRAGDLAFLQYTSGSVGNPKGVEISHANILANLAAIARTSRQYSNSRGFSWLPPYHDMGLIGGILLPLYCGFTVDLMSPHAFLRTPLRWLQCLSDSKATISVAPNFALDLCIESAGTARPEQLVGLDLSAWEVCFVGAEPINAKTLDDFYTAFKRYGFRRKTFLPCYGMAEATLLVAAAPFGSEPAPLALDAHAFAEGHVRAAAPDARAITLVGCGTAPEHHQLLVVDPKSKRRLGEKEIGEIWVAGPSIAQGYWRQRAQTDQTFRAQTDNPESSRPYLRTGDLGFISADQLFVVGRLDDLLILRGRNYHPQDIERCATQSHDALQANAAVCFLDDNTQRLVLVHELRRTHYRQADTDTIMRAMRRAVMQQFHLAIGHIALLKPNSLPRTSSGKVQRQATAKALAQGTLKSAGQWRANDGSKKLETALSWLRTYARTRINSQLIDERRTIPPHIVLDFGNKGLLGLEIPAAYGGPGFSVAESLRIVETLGAIDPTLALFVGVNNALGVRPLLAYGTQEQKDRWLPALATGRQLAAFALTEPGAGANPQKITATAQASIDGNWQLNGHKIWSGNAAWAGLVHVFVQNVDREGRRRGVSAFVVEPSAPGLEMGSESPTMGVRGMVQNDIHLRDVVAGADTLLHTAGSGMEMAQDAMMRARLGIGAIAIGTMKRCAQLMVHYAAGRDIAQGKLIEDPLARTRLTDLTAAITACEALVYRIASHIDAGEHVPHDVFSACKIAVPELAWQAADQLLQMLGGRGYEENNIAPRLVRDVRLLRIFEGPTETLCAYIGTKLHAQNRILTSFLADTWMRPDIAQKLIEAVQTLGDQVPNHVRGQLAAWACLQAALQPDNEQHARADHWAQGQFNRCLTQARQETKAPLAAAEIESLVHEYAADLGSWQQEAAGLKTHIDPLLQYDGPTESSHPEQRRPPHSEKAASFSLDPKPNDLAQWIADHLARELNRPIDPFGDLTELGVDSIMAVQLVDRLEKHLDLPIDPSILWHFPTLATLADELMRQQAAASAAPKKQAEGEGLTEQLKREIALSQQLVRRA